MQCCISLVVLCGAVQCYAGQSSVVKFVQWYVFMYSVKQCSTVFCSAVQCCVVHYRKSGGGDDPYLQPVSTLHITVHEQGKTTLYTLLTAHYTL